MHPLSRLTALLILLLAGPLEAAMSVPVTFESAGQTLHGDLVTLALAFDLDYNP